jgi:HlyD family secretion protein
LNASLLKKPWLIGVVVLALLGGGLLWTRSRGVPVQVHTVGAAELVQSLAVSGRAESETRVFLGATVTGRVAEVSRREGDVVSAGEWVVRLEDAELAAAVRQAEAALRSAQARLSSQRGMAAPMASQQLEQARANAAAAERERQRNEDLYKQGFIGQSRLDEARRAAEVARAAERAAEAQRESNVSGAELATAEARVAEARAALELARARLAQTRISAPADATVLSRLVEPGQIVQPGTRVVELSVRGPLQLVAQVDEKHVGKLAPGMSAVAVADAFPSRPFEARIAAIAPLVDAQRGAVEVKFVLPAAAAASAAATALPPLKNDMTVSIEVVTGRRTKALAVPGDALRPGPAVLVLEGDRTALRRVKTGLRTLSAVEIVEGLREGDNVVLDAAVGAGVKARAMQPQVQPGEGVDLGSAMRGLGRD